MFKTRFISMLVLLMTAVTGAWADTTVTWTASDMSRIYIDFWDGEADNNTIKGITVTSSGGGGAGASWEGTYIDLNSGSTTITFTSSVGKIKSIAITTEDIEMRSIPSGWTTDYSTLSWSGEASTTVPLPLSGWTEISGISEIVFTIGPATVAVTGVTLAPTSATLTLGETETVTLIPTVLPGDATDKSVTWSSSNEAVATVADGVVTAVAAGTATITATATNGTADTSDDFSATCEVTVADAATNYDLTLADGSDAHGTVTFSVGGNAVTQAKKDDLVTVSVTPDEGYSAKDVTVRAYTSWEAASEILTGGGDNPGLVSDITVTKNETDGTWSFTMPEANVWVVVTYTKNLQDAWIQTIADQTYTGSAITPTVTVKDGETTLVLNTDYTVAYSNNVETGTATVTVTGTGNYSGTATANFTIVADKSALNTAITEAETYYNSIKDDHAEAAAALKTAIDNAKAMQEKGDATQEEVNNALSALTTAKTTAEDAVLTETKTALNNDITAAETYYNSIKDSNPTAAATLLEAINAAKTVKDNANATQEQVDTAIAALASAKTTAEQTVLTETKTALNDDITDAEAYYNSIKDSNPAAAATLLDAINAAKTVKDNADATQEQVETAAQTLTDALNAAKADVALKRITLTIPAKSYMARIDADKRQIETAVAGVKLYSVKSVTNTEVELTGELSVIAAEMPYFIYNDNDTEVEVSIIVSSEEADNVDYDSEHFKGTLVDKTFTDEDMEEADHYVLSGGSSFVWVKDAGTLSAGKCWIELVPASDAHARTLNIVFEGTTTGINAVNAAATMDGNIYDLSGRRVAQPAKGIYVKNGKKVIVK